MASWLALVNVLVARVAPCPLRKKCADNPAPPAARRVSDVIPPPPPPPPPPPAKPPSFGQTQLEPEQDPVAEFEVVDAVANYMPLFLPPDQLTSSARGRSVRHSDPKCPMALSILPRNRKVLSQQEASASGLFLCNACKGRRGLIKREMTGQKQMSLSKPSSRLWTSFLSPIQALFCEKVRADENKAW